MLLGHASAGEQSGGEGMDAGLELVAEREDTASDG